MFNFSRLAKAASVAALTVGVAFAAQPAQKASAQVVGTGSSAAAGLYTYFGANYSATSSGDCLSGTDNGNDFCATDIPYPPADGYTETQTANLIIDAPVNAGDTGISLGEFCAIFTGQQTTWSDGTPITVVYRNNLDSNGNIGSGTAYNVQEQCGDYGSDVPGAIGVSSSGAVVSTVASIPGAIGYAEQANVIAGGGTNALATPISGPTYAIYNANNSPNDVIDFINGILNDPADVCNAGYTPVNGGC